MTLLEPGSYALFSVSAIGVLVLFGLYPLALRCRSRTGAPPPPPIRTRSPSISFLVAVRNGEALIEDKVRNSLALRCPGALQHVFVSDGSDDATLARLHAAAADRVVVIDLARHVGKAAALDAGVCVASGEILVFSDADALLKEDALQHLAERFADPTVGGVCGLRVIRDDRRELDIAQSGYIAADSAVKLLESRLGSVTSNDGKLYAIRRALYRPIAPGATDDLFACLSVVEQGKRFVFEPRARAFIPSPSRSAAHELSRRRRIVARSLHGIAIKRKLLDPRRHGFFSIQLLVNKVLRRMLPLFVAGLLISSLVLAVDHSWARWVVGAQLAFFALAAAHGRIAASTRVAHAASLAYYFCVGNLGTLLGLADFLRGRVTVKWDPIKDG